MCNCWKNVSINILPPMSLITLSYESSSSWLDIEDTAEDILADKGDGEEPEGGVQS